MIGVSGHLISPAGAIRIVNLIVAEILLLRALRKIAGLLVLLKCDFSLAKQSYCSAIVPHDHITLKSSVG